MAAAGLRERRAGAVPRHEIVASEYINTRENVCRHTQMRDDTAFAISEKKCNTTVGIQVLGLGLHAS